MGFYACTFGGFCAILQKAARLSHTVLLLQLIPARGRKPFVLPIEDMTRLMLQLIPARGRKLNIKSVLGLTNVATYPREGTETRPIDADELIKSCNLSPRGDGNCFVLIAAAARESCNLSPRGDGNHGFGAVVHPSDPCCNLSPRGDGNPTLQTCALILSCCNLSPRGDGNSDIRIISFNCALQLIPARGRKPLLHSCICTLALLQLIPARGRKPSG